ncbi:NADH:flavin oxidoreductase [Novosphingobium sp. G106]|nr:NADH:flavin oxidoreductase [Novosphingobium sp. G106]
MGALRVRSNHRLEPLLQSLSVRALTVANRFVMSPMTREKSPGRVPGPDVAQYYRRRAEGKVGLIVTEGVAIDDPAAVDYHNVPAMHGEDALAGWRHVVEQVHAAGGKIFPQLWHQGAMRDAAISPWPEIGPRRPSGVVGPFGKASLAAEVVARISPDTAPMTDSEIGDIIAAYGRSAKYAATAGFDGIAIHGGHGYLPDNFLWHGTNHRVDRWGGDHRGRATFVAELVKEIRSRVGKEMPILFRFSQWRMQDYASRLAETPTELEQLLTPIADAGVDIFDGSQRYFDTPMFEGSPLNLAGWAKKLTGKLGMTVGAVGLAETRRDHAPGASDATDNLDRLVERFERGEFDLVAVGRALLNDPDWLGKAIRGEPFLPFDAANLARLN